MNILLGLVTSGIVGTLVFTILLLLRPISEKLFSKTWHYYSLFVPLFFLLGGTLLAPNLTIERRHAMTEINIAANTSQETFQVPYFARPAIEGTAAQTSPVATPNTVHINPRYIIMLWIFGAVLFAVVSVKNYLQYRRLLLSNAKHFKSDCKLPVLISPTAYTPLLLGFIKPVIVLPNMHFSDAELNIILAHELIHYRRKDLFWKMLSLIANAIHWYNPAMYIFNRQLSIFCELSCDEKVVSEMDTSNRKFYGETILQVLHHNTVQPSNVLLATNLCNSQKNIKRRLKSMMNSSKKMRKSIAALALAVAMLVVGGGFVISHIVDSVMPVYAADSPDTVEETRGAPTRPIVYDGIVMGAETTEYAESFTVEATPLIFDSGCEMLEAIYEKMGNIMWPTYIPEGFVLTSIGLTNPQNDSPWPELFTDGCYRHLDNLLVNFSDGESNILLCVRFFQPYTRYGNGHRRLTADDMPTLNYSERHITINGFNATIGRYTGIILSDIDNGLSHRFSASANSVVNYSGTSYQLLADHDGVVSEQDLIRVAESLTYILNLMQ